MPEAAAWITDAADMLTHKVDYQNGPDSLQLRYAGAVLDAVAYGDFGADEIAAGEGDAVSEPAPGQSLGRTSDGSDTDDNATDFSTQASPSPGAPNGL